MSLDDGCLSLTYVGVAIHELMHAIGFAHEQQRPDQKDYVNVLYDNIKEGKTKKIKRTSKFISTRCCQSNCNFSIMITHLAEWKQWYRPFAANQVDTLGLPYDTSKLSIYNTLISSQPFVLFRSFVTRKIN